MMIFTTLNLKQQGSNMRYVVAVLSILLIAFYSEGIRNNFGLSADNTAVLIVFVILGSVNTWRQLVKRSNHSKQVFTIGT